MEKIIEEENQQNRDAAMMLQSLNWKERKEILQRIQSEPSLLGLYAMNVERLLKDTNIVCLQLILQLLEDNVDKFTFQLPEIVNILTNVVLQNTKTSIKTTVVRLLQQIHGVIPHQVAQTLGQAALSNNSKFARQCLEIMQGIGGSDISAALALPIQHKNAEIKNFALTIAKQQLQSPESLQAMEREFPSAIFQQILVEAVESVAGDTASAPTEQLQAQPVQKSAVHKSQAAPDAIRQSSGDFPRQDALQREIELPNMDKMQWKDKKDCIEAVSAQIEHGASVSYEFGRQLKYLLDNEANSACSNALIHMAQVCAFNIRQWRHSRPVFSSVLQKLRDKRAAQLARRAVPAFLYQQFRLQDVLDEFIACLQSKQTDQKQETASMLRSLFVYERDESSEYG